MFRVSILGVRSVGEHVESDPAVVRPTPMASRFRSLTRPYPKMDASQSKDTQPGEASATAANPEPASPEVTEAPLPSYQATVPDGRSVLDIALVTTQIC